MTTMNAKEVAATPGAVLVDVRTPGEFAAEHVEGALLMPLDRLDPATVQGLVEETGRCVLMCQAGKRAAMAAERLRAAGIGDVAVLTGGIEAWKQAGLAVVRGRGVISIERQVRIGAGALVVLGVALGAWVHPGFLGLAAFVGCGLIFAGVTDFCGMGLLLARMPWNQRAEAGAGAVVRA